MIYETDILDNTKHQETADRIFDYLGLNPHPVTTDLKRITVDRLQDMIINYEEIEKRLKGTRFEKYLV